MISFASKLKVILPSAFLFFALSLQTTAQKTQGLEALDKETVDELFTGSLIHTLEKFEKRYGISFNYNIDQLKDKTFFYRAFDNSLRDVIKTICTENKLKYFIEDGKIVLVGKNEGNVSAINKKVNTKIKVEKSITPKRSNFNLSGIVKDSKTGESIPSATIYVSGTSLATNSNSDGYFSLLNVPSDTSTLVFSYLGYKKEFIKLNPDLKMENMLFEMTEEGTSLDEVVVHGESEALLKVPQELSAIQISPKQLAQLPNVGEKDIMRSFQMMPGVSASNESSSGLYVRGGTPDQNLVLYDGFTVYHVDHLYGFFSAFNANAIKDVKLFKGGFESKYGGRLASVTEITGKEGNQRQFNIGGEVSLLSANAYAEVPIGEKFNVLLAARRSYQGPIYNKIFDRFNSTQQQQGPQGGGGIPGQENVKATSYFYDLNGKISYRPTNKDIISLSIYNGTDDLDNSQKIETPTFLANSGFNLDIGTSDKTNYGNIGSSLKWAKQWNNKLYSNQLISFSNYYSTRERSVNGSFTPPDGESRTIRNGTFEDNSLYDYSYRNDLTYELSQKHKLGFGTELTHYDIAYSYAQSDTAKILDRANTGSTAAVYLQDQFKLTSRLSVTPGLRATYFSITGKPYLEPRLAANYDLTQRIKLKAATGLYYQFANRITREDILAGSRDFWILADGDKLPVSSSQHYIVGATYELPKYLFSAEAFHKENQGLTEYTLRFNVNPNRINYSENFYNGNGYVDGFELLAQRKLGNFTGWMGYTFLYSKNKFDVYGKSYYSSNQDITNEFKMVGIYKIKRWTFSATWIYATGRPYTAPMGGYSVKLLDGTSQDYISVGDKNANRLPDYHRLDLAVNFTLKNADGKEIGYLGGSIFNLYNRTNVWYKKYDVVDNQVIETNVNYLDITPNLTLSLHLR